MNKDQSTYDPIKEWMEGNTTDHANDETIQELLKIDQSLTKHKALGFQKQLAWEAIASQSVSQEAKTRRLTTFNWAVRIAAAITIVLVAGYLIVYRLGFFSGHEINTLAGQKEQFYLPDSSAVYLNAVSSLTYENDFEDERVLDLEGEAYFEVTHGKSFMVNTSNGIVEVLGTRFNVIDRAAFFEVVCLEGKVRVFTAKGNSTILTPGKSVRLTDSGFEEDNKPDLTTLPAWVMGRSEFKSLPLYLVINEYERQFDLSIAIENIDVTQLYTGSFSHDNLQEAFRTLAATLGVSHKIIDGKSVLLRGESM